MLVLLNAASYEESHAFLCHCSKVMAFCSVVGTVNLVKMASRLSGYWSSANNIESFDCLICGSALIDCNNRRICLAVIVEAIILVLCVYSEGTTHVKTYLGSLVIIWEILCWVL
jgi:hypothetical protein